MRAARRRREILAAETGVPNPMTSLRHFHEGPARDDLPDLVIKRYRAAVHARETQEDSDYRWRLFAQRGPLLRDGRAPEI